MNRYCRGGRYELDLVDFRDPASSSGHCWTRCLEITRESGGMAGLGLLSDCADPSPSV
jgi:hypothetical protein